MSRIFTGIWFPAGKGIVPKLMDNSCWNIKLTSVEQKSNYRMGHQDGLLLQPVATWDFFICHRYPYLFHFLLLIKTLMDGKNVGSNAILTIIKYFNMFKPNNRDSLDILIIEVEKVWNRQHRILMTPRFYWDISRPPEIPTHSQEVSSQAGL